MNIAINTSSFPFTVTFHRIVWMHQSYVVSKFWRLNSTHQEQIFELISKIQKTIIDATEESVDSLLSINLSKIELRILKNATSAISFGDHKEFSILWKSSRELLESTIKQFKED